MRPLIPNPVRDIVGAALALVLTYVPPPYAQAGEPPATGSISGQVFVDLNNNLAPDPQEPALAGVGIALNNDLGDPIATTQTDASGEYRFSALSAGTYAVVQSQPIGYASSTPNIQVTEVAAGAAISSVNFGEKAGSIGGRVFVDANENGIQEAGEAALVGVQIRLEGIDATEAPIDQVLVTDADGLYASGPLLAGAYRLTQTQPLGPMQPPRPFPDGPQIIGSAGGTATSADTIDGILIGPGVDGSGYAFTELRFAQSLAATPSPDPLVFSPGGSFSLAVAGGESDQPITVVNDTPGICSLDGSLGSILGAGVCLLRANQAGNALFVPAPELVIELLIARAPQAISFEAPAAQRLGSAPLPLLASSTSSLPVAIEALNPGVCSVSNGSVSFSAVGLCSLRATQAGDGNWLAALPVERSFQVLAALAAPGAPTALQTEQIGNTLTVSWSPPQDDGGSPVTSYRVTAQPGGEVCLAVGTPVPLTCSFRNLPYGQYSFAVVAINAVGTGPEARVQASTLIAPPTVVPATSLTSLLLLMAALLAVSVWHKRG